VDIPRALSKQPCKATIDCNCCCLPGFTSATPGKLLLTLSYLSGQRDFPPLGLAIGYAEAGTKSPTLKVGGELATFPM